ncbi:MAG: molybdenum cofactor biosynthesis protein MoaE [Paracoccaceae bacterium]
MKVILQKEAFDPGQIINEFQIQLNNVGAVVNFIGIVRNNKESNLKKLHIEHYPQMTRHSLEEVQLSSKKRWDLQDSLIIHRYGDLEINEPIMMVMTAAKHRHEAFNAAEFLMDYLKSRAPFWKKEITNDGSEWVLSTEDDENSLNRW